MDGYGGYRRFFDGIECEGELLRRACIAYCCRLACTSSHASAGRWAVIATASPDRHGDVPGARDRRLGCVIGSTLGGRETTLALGCAASQSCARNRYLGGSDLGRALTQQPLALACPHDGTGAALALGVVSVNEPKIPVHRLIERAYAKCPDCTVMLYRDCESSSAAGFYARQTGIPVIDSESDGLWWAQVKHPAAESFVTSADVLRRAMRDGHISVLVTRHECSRFWDPR